MTVTRNYVWTVRPSDPAELPRLAKKARKVLAWACEGDDRLTCRGITGEAVGVIQLTFTVVGRDLWAAGQLGQDVITLATRRLKSVAHVSSLPRPPHMHRGYAYGREKRVNSPRRPRTPRPS
jgi:hypothetical protein